MSASGPLPSTLLKPLVELASLYREYGSIPRVIAAVISLYIVNTILSIGGFAVSILVSAGNIVSGAFVIVRELLVGAFSVVGVNILGIYQWLIGVLAGVVASLGPFGPPLAIGVGAVLVYSAYRVTIVLLGELPLGSSIVDLLGLR